MPRTAGRHAGAEVVVDGQLGEDPAVGRVAACVDDGQAHGPVIGVVRRSVEAPAQVEVGGEHDVGTEPADLRERLTSIRLLGQQSQRGVAVPGNLLRIHPPMMPVDSRDGLGDGVVHVARGVFHRHRLEAALGAIYLDRGITAARRFIHTLFEADARSRAQAYCHAGAHERENGLGAVARQRPEGVDDGEDVGGDAFDGGAAVCPAADATASASFPTRSRTCSRWAAPGCRSRAGRGPVLRG